MAHSDNTPDKCALHFDLNFETKSTLQEIAKHLDINVSDLLRISIRILIPILTALIQAESTIVTDLVNRRRRGLRKRHGISESEIKTEMDMTGA